MHYYLSAWLGIGSDTAPFRPAIGAAAELDGAAWWTIDLRPDPTARAGRCLLATTTRAADESGGRYLGEGLDDTLPALVRQRLANDLGLSLTRLDLRRVVVELLTDHARDDGTRWRALRPLRRGPHAWEIHLGGLLWSLPRVAGGAVHTESFTGADNLSLQSADVDLVWTNVSASGWSVASTRGSILGTSTGAVYARAEHDAASPDMYAQGVIHTLTDSTAQCGICARYDSGANTSYMAQRGIGTLDDVIIRKTVSGSRTNLTSAVTVTSALPETLRTECEGSTIRALLGGVPCASVTDTSITTGTRAGLYGFRPSGGNVVVDDFAFGDLGGPSLIEPTGITSAEAFGAPSVAPGAVELGPTGIASGEAFGAPALTPGPVTLTPTGIPTSEACGTPTLTPGAVVLSPTGIATGEAIGQAIVALTVSPAGAQSAEAFGTPAVSPGPVSIAPAGIAPAEAFGLAAVTGGVQISWPPRPSEVVLIPVATATVTLI